MLCLLVKITNYIGNSEILYFLSTGQSDYQRAAFQWETVIKNSVAVDEIEVITIRSVLI